VSVDVIAVAEPAAVVLDCIGTDALVDELARRDGLGKAIKEATAEQIADDLAERADICAGSAAIAWRDAQDHDDDLQLLETAERLARSACYTAEKLAAAAQILLPTSEHPIARRALEGARAAAVAYRRTRELFERARTMAAHRRQRGPVARA
jgi:hypothetical protein